MDLYPVSLNSLLICRASFVAELMRYTTCLALTLGQHFKRTLQFH